MADAVRTAELARLLRSKRRGLTVRQAAVKAGVSPATYWRAEKGDSPRDIEVIQKLCDWLGVPAARVIGGVRTISVHKDDRIEHGQTESTTDMIEAHLRADRQLDEPTASALADAFRQLYEVSRKKKPPK